MAGTRILVADELPFYRRYLAEIFRHGGFDALEAADADEVMALLREPRNAPGILLLDGGLPPAGAVELMPRLRERAPREQLTVLVLPRERSGANLLRATGADGWMYKDAPPEHVLYRIRQLLARSGQERRTSPRRLVDAPVCFQTADGHGVGRLVDVGIGGLRLRTLKPPPEAGTPVQVSFTLNDHDTVLEAEGRVVRPGELRFSVVFGQLDKQAQETISRFMQNG